MFLKIPDEAAGYINRVQELKEKLIFVIFFNRIYDIL